MITNCLRCHVRCQTGKRDPEARLLAVSETRGYCANCAVTDWLLHASQTVADIIARAPKGQFPAALRLAHIQQQFGAIMTAGAAQLRPEQIDWDEVIANWDLPFPQKAPRRRRAKQ